MYWSEIFHWRRNLLFQLGPLVPFSPNKLISIRNKEGTVNIALLTFRGHDANQSKCIHLCACVWSHPAYRVGGQRKWVSEKVCGDRSDWLKALLCFPTCPSSNRGKAIETNPNYSNPRRRPKAPYRLLARLSIAFSHGERGKKAPDRLGYWPSFHLSCILQSSARRRLWNVCILVALSVAFLSHWTLYVLYLCPSVFIWRTEGYIVQETHITDGLYYFYYRHQSLTQFDVLFDDVSVICSPGKKGRWLDNLYIHTYVKFRSRDKSDHWIFQEFFSKRKLTFFRLATRIGIWSVFSLASPFSIRLGFALVASGLLYLGGVCATANPPAVGGVYQTNDT